MTIINQGDSANITLQLYDCETPAVAINKVSIITLKVTQTDKISGDVINSRSDQDVLDNNDGLVAEDGILTLRLGTLDSVNAGSLSVGHFETHVLIFEWTWSDGVQTRYGSHRMELDIRITSDVTPTTEWVG